MLNVINKMSLGMTGKKHSEETKRKMSLSQKGLNAGSRNHFWKGGTRQASINKWREENKDRVRAYDKKRLIKIADNGGSHSLGEWETLKKQYNERCASCKKSVKLQRDHIIPVSKGGSNNIENIQPLCQSCNSKKYNKVIKY